MHSRSRTQQRSSGWQGTLPMYLLVLLRSTSQICVSMCCFPSRHPANVRALSRGWAVLGSYSHPIHNCANQHSQSSLCLFKTCFGPHRWSRTSQHFCTWGFVVVSHLACSTITAIHAVKLIVFNHSCNNVSGSSCLASPFSMLHQSLRLQEGILRLTKKLNNL